MHCNSYTEGLNLKLALMFFIAQEPLHLFKPAFGLHYAGALGGSGVHNTSKALQSAHTTAGSMLHENKEICKN